MLSYKHKRTNQYLGFSLYSNLNVILLDYQFDYLLINGQWVFEYHMSCINKLWLLYQGYFTKKEIMIDSKTSTYQIIEFKY